MLQERWEKINSGFYKENTKKKRTLTTASDLTLHNHARTLSEAISSTVLPGPSPRFFWYHLYLTQACFEITTQAGDRVRVRVNSESEAFKLNLKGLENLSQICRCQDFFEDEFRKGWCMQVNRDAGRPTNR